MQRAHLSWVTRTRLAVAFGKMSVEELDHERRRRRQTGWSGASIERCITAAGATAHIPGGVAATEQVLAVCRDMPFQLRTRAWDMGFS